MKRLLFSALFVAWAGPCPAPPIPVCPDCVSDTFDNGPLSATGEPLASGEYVTSGDFNGDGRLDVLLLDKATGLWRRGSEDALGPGFTFDQARPSGLEHVTGLAAGYFRQEGITAVAACSASTNRLHFILNGAASLNADAQPHEVTLPAAGPSALAAVDVPTVGTTTLPELTVATEAGVGTNLQRHVLGMTQTGGEFLNSSTPVNQRVLRLAPILIGDGTHVLGALLVDGTMSHRFELWQPAAGNFNTASAVLNPLVGARFISGFFDGDHADVLFYTEGSSTVRASRISLNTSNQPVPSPLQSHLLARTLRALYPLKRGAATEALALYTDGTAAVLDYAQGSGFSTVSSIDLANVPMPITGALPLPTGDFLMLTGDPADPSAGTTHAHRFNYDAATGGSRLVWTGALPAARLSSAAGNVLVFTADPLSDPNARLVRVAHVRDWTRNLSWPDQPGLKDLSLHAESYLNRNAGLGNPQPTTLPWFVGNGQFALGNQTTEAISMFTFDATLGERLDEVIVDPAPGSYDRAVHVMLRTRDPNMTLLYRKNGYDAFGAFPPGGLWLYGDATLEYFGSSNGQLTPRKSADFRFTRSAKEQDADGDGVPDFVEVAYGLDPEGSLTGEGTPTDFDGDGWSDLNEILAGANPGGPGVPGLADPAQHPAPNWLPPPTSQQFKLWVKPRGVQPAGTQAVAGPGTVVEAHDTTGTFLAKASMISYNDGSRWAHLAVPDTGDAQRIILLSTPPHFLPGPEPWPEPEPSTWPEKEPSGRELLGYVRIPPVTPLAFDFTFNPLEDPTAQAQAWVNARRAATGGARTEPVVELSYLSTLKVLLLERILRDLGPMRGLMFS
ncbi:MAG: hypothetical protein ACOYMN_12020, partial [Roseimicrobium sp.]